MKRLLTIVLVCASAAALAAPAHRHASPKPDSARALTIRFDDAPDNRAPLDFDSARTLTHSRADTLKINAAETARRAVDGVLFSRLRWPSTVSS